MINVKTQIKKLMPILPGQSSELVSSPQTKRIRLADFIQENTKQIVSEWENFARTLTPAANDMTSAALRDHIQQMLVFIVADIKTFQTGAEQVEKSKGEKEPVPGGPSAAETHAALRLSAGFDIGQMVSEWRALRASVIKLWNQVNTQVNSVDILDLTRFNEAIDQELAESVNHYTNKVNYSKDLLMGILSHDLRNPLNVISMSTQLMLDLGTMDRRQSLNARQTLLATQIFESTTRITNIIDDLLDVTRSRFGSGLPVICAPMDMGFVSRQLVDEMRIAYPQRIFTLKISGDVKGDWDKARIGQVFANLIGNAVQYSFSDTPISVIVQGGNKEVILSVHNEGVPIPASKVATVFDCMTRAVTDNGEKPEGINLGLGLYIIKDIVISHGGSIDVTSTENEGTNFVAHFPRLT